MKNFIVPCFVVVSAKDKKDAVKIARGYEKMKNGSCLLVDKILQPVQLTRDITTDFPKTYRPFFYSHRWGPIV